MKGIILYSSKYGCTEKAAKLLQSKIQSGIKAVNVANEKAPDLSSFDTVILGGPIYAGKMYVPFTKYLKQNLDVLKAKRLALFICAGEEKPEEMEKLFAAAFPEELVRNAIMKVNFGGELRFANIGFMMKFILKTFIGVKEDYSRLSEEKIDRFAKGVLEVQV